MNSHWFDRDTCKFHYHYNAKVWSVRNVEVDRVSKRDNELYSIDRVAKWHEVDKRINVFGNTNLIYDEERVQVSNNWER